MLRRSFLHLPGFTVDREANLWTLGIHDWDDAKASEQIDREGKRAIEKSESALVGRDAVYFNRLYPSSERWRLLPDFRDEIAFLDIETTGLGGEAYITMCGVLDATGYKAYVRGDNLDQVVLDLNRYKVIVTFNGISFDIPWIRKELTPELQETAHVDLMYVLRGLGLRGGLKQIERAIGLDRGDDLSLLNGRDAVSLWHMAQEGEPRALETLIRYNAEDLASLPLLAEFAYRKHSFGTPMTVPGLHWTTVFDTTRLPYDASLIQYLKG